MKFFDNVRNVLKQGMSSQKNSANTQNSTQENFLKNMLKGFNGHNQPFVVDVFGESFLTPHREMRIVKSLYFYNSLAQRIVNSYAQKIAGHDVYITAEDEKTENILNSLFELSNLKDERTAIFQNILRSGQSYLRRFDLSFNSTGIVYFDRIQYPERIYKDFDRSGRIVRYIFETLTHSDNYFSILYQGDQRIGVRGKSFSTDEILEFKFGENTIAEYGRSPLASAVNDAKILFEIERSMAVAARYKSMDRHIFNFRDMNSQQEKEHVKGMFGNILDKQNYITNREDLEIHHLTNNTRDIDWSSMLQHLKRKITLTIASQYSIDGESTNYSVGDNQHDDERLAIKNMREIYTKTVKKILKNMISKMDNVSGNFDIEFSDLSSREEKEKAENATQMWNNYSITLNEYREKMGLEPVSGEEGELYKHELDTMGGAGVRQ